MTDVTDASTSPLVSIGIPTYNRVIDLERALSSALAQDYPNLEVIVSDNGSADGTESLCRRTAAADSRLRYFRQPTNRGAHANFRTVLAESRGDFFMWLGDDDWLESSYVSTCIDAFGDDDSIVCGFDRYFTNGSFVFEGPRLNLRETSGADRVVSYYRQVTVNGTFYGLMRRRLIAQIETSGALGGDWFALAAMAYLGKIKTLNNVSVCRSAGGESQDVPALAAKLGMAEMEVQHPFLAIAVSAFRDIAWHSRVYDSLGPLQRIRLAGAAFRTIVRRHYSRRHTPTVARYLLWSIARRN